MTGFRRAALAAVAALVFATSSFAASTTVVISQIYGGAGCGTAGCSTYKNDYVELFNRGTSAVSLAGWSVQYASATGNFSAATPLPNVTLQPGQYFLVGEGSGSNGVNALPTPDVQGSIAMSATVGKVLLASTSSALGTACPSGATVVDLVGYGTTANCFEGSLAPAPSTANAIFRAGAGCTETDVNGSDFASGAANPRNTGSSFNPCSTSIATPPTAAASATPNSNLAIGGSTLLTVTVTPGTNPTSSGIGVTGDLTSIGGSSSQALYDDGSHGDATANDNTFSFTATIASGTQGGSKTLTFSISDAQSRSASTSTTLTVLAPSNPGATAAANPSSVATGASTLLTVTVTAGTNPASSGLVVTGDLSSIGGSASQTFYDDATHGDVTAGDKVFSWSASIPSSTTLGGKTLPIAVVDAQSRSAVASINLTVTRPTIPAGTVVISQIYGGGGNAGSTLHNDFIELFNRSSSPVSVDGWSVQHFSSSFGSWQSTTLSGVIQPHGYYLVQEAAGTTAGGGTVALPTPDAVGTIGLSSTAGTVALSTSDTLLTGTICATSTDIIDWVGYGAGSSCSGRVTLGNALSNTVGASRGLGGCKYTNSATDFTVGPPSPRNSSTPANDCSTAVEQITPHVMISQIYGGGGNSGATYSNDFVELYNPTDADVSLEGWSIQYASATGNGWGGNSQPLGGTIASHGYFLIELAAGANTFAALPPPRIISDINMSGGSGKLALVNRFEPLSGNCPIGDPSLVDFIGYGTVDCFEGGLSAPSLSNNTQSLIRAASSDTNQNSVDFSRLSPPNPRGSGELVELPPLVSSVDPKGADAPDDASLTVNFSEPVTVAAGWLTISCPSSGTHSDIETASAFGGRTWILTPNQPFAPGETCTVHIFRSLVEDVDTNDGPNTNNLPADVEWTFSAIVTGDPLENPAVHLTMGNPSDAVPSLAVPNNFLMEKPEFALSYNRDKGTANWVSWHLADLWVATGNRTDTFRPDPALPPTWYRVLQTDYAGTGFDRGHMCPSADRNLTIAVNQPTFVMTNMVPQSPENNQGPWEDFEGYLRTLVVCPTPCDEVYIVSGPYGSAGTIANGHVTVPEGTWKVALVLPKMDGNDLQRVNAATTTIAIKIPNSGIAKSDSWTKYLTTVRDVEQLTGYDFFSNITDRRIQNAIERGSQGTNPPGVADQSVNAVEDVAAAVALSAVSPDPAAAITYTVGAPAHGTLTPGATAGSYTYTPAADFNGTDSFTFSANDGHFTSNTSTVTLHVAEVNDAPVAAADVNHVEAGSTLTFAAGALTANDSPGPSNESAQSLTVTAVAATADTHGTVTLAGGNVTYTPAIPYTGPANFTYTVCDNGTTGGGADSKCATGTVAVNVTDTLAPSISALTPSTATLWPVSHQLVAVTVDYSVSDSGDAAPTCSLQVLSNEAINGIGDGNTAPDYQIIDAHHLMLRSERSGAGSDRIYKITATCADHSGNSATSAAATVVVPKSQR